jgi:hypothetical protein
MGVGWFIGIVLILFTITFSIVNVLSPLLARLDAGERWLMSVLSSAHVGSKKTPSEFGQHSGGKGDIDPVRLTSPTANDCASVKPTTVSWLQTAHHTSDRHRQEDNPV